MSYLKNYQGFIQILESAGVNPDVIDALKNAVEKSVSMDSAVSGTAMLKDYINNNMQSIKDLTSDPENIKALIGALEPWYDSYVHELDQEETGSSFADEMKDEEEKGELDNSDFDEDMFTLDD